MKVEKAATTIEDDDDDNDDEEEVEDVVGGLEAVGRKVFILPPPRFSPAYQQTLVFLKLRRTKSPPTLVFTPTLGVYSTEIFTIIIP